MLLALWFDFWSWVGAPIPDPTADGCYLLAEDGAYLALETGTDFLVVEVCGQENNVAYNGNRYRDYQPTHYELQARKALEKQVETTQQDIKTAQIRIEDLELVRLRDLADEQMQMELLALLLEEQRLQMLLLEQQKRLAMLRDDEEALTLLMMLI